MTTLYIAGPMTGYPQFNFPAFAEAAATLRSQGLTIISPAEEDEQHGVAQVAITSTDGKLDANGKIAGQTWGDLLSRDVKIVADLVDGVAVLKNWERSKGAKLEVTVALLAGKTVYAYHEGAGLTTMSREWVKEVLNHNL
jgi:hypothetical protein